MELVTIRHRAHNGQIAESHDACGGVFRPLRDRGVTAPAWVYGPKNATRVMFTCPVSAIPDEVFALYRLWSACRLTHTLPLAGGFLDQPLAVQTAWPIFEDELQVLTAAPKN